MKKLLPVAFVLVIVAILGLYWWVQNQETKNVSSRESSVKASPEAMTTPETKPGFANSIRDAMGLGQKMQCTYTYQSGNTSLRSTTTLDGKRFRSETEMEGGIKAYGLLDGETQYSWMSNSSQGFKIDKKCLAELQSTIPQDSKSMPDTPSGGAVKDLEGTFDLAQNVQCVPAATIDFSLPSGIIFTDQCAMMKQGLESLKDIQNKLPKDLPKGIDIPGVMPQ